MAQIVRTGKPERAAFYGVTRSVGHDSDSTIAQKGILATCPEKIRETTSPNLHVASESQVHCAIH